VKKRVLGWVWWGNSMGGSGTWGCFFSGWRGREAPIERDVAEGVDRESLAKTLQIKTGKTG